MADRVEDFTREPAPLAADGGSARPRATVAKVYDPGPERESIRGRIAMLLLWLMASIIGELALLLVAGVLKSVDDLLKLSGALLTPVVGLSGAVMGFYFGEKSTAPAAAPRRMGMTGSIKAIRPGRR